MINDKKKIMNKIKQTMYIPPKSTSGGLDMKGMLLELLLEVDEYVGKGIDLLNGKKRK